MSKPLTPAAGYIRMSSDLQEASPAQQRKAINELAAKHGYSIIRWYEDLGISGDATEKRKGFLQMIKDAEEKGDFAAILCWDQDRFGRFDSIEAGRWIHPLRCAGVWLVTVAQGQIDWNDFTSRMMYSITQEGKHQFLVDLSRNVLRGKINRAKIGRSGNLPPFGYDRLFNDEKGNTVRRVKYGEKFQRPKGWTVRFVISEDAEMVNIVRWIFDTYANTDTGVNWIAGDLNRRKVRSPNGKEWSAVAITKMLTNPGYTGANVFGRYRVGKYHHLSKGEAAKGKSKQRKGEPIVTQGIHEALINPETFERVQQRIASRLRKNVRPRYNDYILSGLLHCAHCGGAMAGKGCDTRNTRQYYRCITAASNPDACRRYQIPQAKIEEHVLGIIEKELFQPSILRKIKAEIFNRAKSTIAFQSDTKALKSRIAAMEQKITKGTENLLLANPDDIADLSTMLGAWRKERDQLQTELESTITNAGGSPEEKAQKAVAALESMKQNLQSKQPMRVRAALKALVEDIQIWFEPYGKQTRFVRGKLIFKQNVHYANDVTG
jgi:DNA invertase Pin-like site-specific DNA recombinase